MTLKVFEKTYWQASLGSLRYKKVTWANVLFCIKLKDICGVKYIMECSLFDFLISTFLPGTSALPELQQICQYLAELRAHLVSLQKESQLLDQWCHVGYVLDFLLFRIYLLIISCYAMVIVTMWCIWITQT